MRVEDNTTKKKRTYRRRGYRSRNRMAKYKSGAGVQSPYQSGVQGIQPRSILRKLPYKGVLTASGAPIVLRNFRGNSVFDPDQSGTGNQPTGFDQYAALYDRYRVHGATFKVTAFNKSATIPAGCIIQPVSDTSFAPTSIREAAMQPSTKFVSIPPLGADATEGKMYRSTKNVLQVSNIKDEYSISATVTGNPTIEWYWVIAIGSIDALANVDASIWFEITYYVEFYNRKSLAQS